MNEIKITYKNTGMFVMLPHSFIEDSKNLKVHTRWLYVALFYYRNNKSGTAFPSYDTIRELTGLRREMISKGLDELEESGWIKTPKRRYGNSNVYTILTNKKESKEGKKSPNS